MVCHTGVHAKGLLTLPSPYPPLVVPLPPWCVQPVLNCTEFYSVQQGDSCAHIWNADPLAGAVQVPQPRTHGEHPGTPALSTPLFCFFCAHGKVLLLPLLLLLLLLLLL